MTIIRHRPMQPSRSLFFLLSLLFIGGSVHGGNLPQRKISVAIKGKQHQALRAYVRTLEGTPDGFPAAIEKILTSALPKEYRKGCTEMVAEWGETARRTEMLLPRPLYLATMPDSTRHVVLAYTCFSSAPTYGDRFYDERLAALTIGRAGSTLVMLPLARDCNACSELSHLGLQDDTLQIGGAPAFTITSGVSNDNPCCGGTTSVDEKHVTYFVLDGRGVTPMVSMLEYRKEVDHAEGGEDSTTVYAARRYLEKDARGNVARILGQYELSINGEPTRRGIVEFIWNQKRKAFDEVQK